MMIINICLIFIFPKQRFPSNIRFPRRDGWGGGGEGTSRPKFMSVLRSERAIRHGQAWTLLLEGEDLLSSVLFSIARGQT